MAYFFKAFALSGRQVGVHNYRGVAQLRNFCPFRAYWVISTVQVEVFSDTNRKSLTQQKVSDTDRKDFSDKTEKGFFPDTDRT